jgi:undecaprenyl-diphosphatase
LTRWLAPDGRLELPLFIGLLVGLLALGLFAAVAADVAEKGALTRFDDRVRSDVAEHAEREPAVTNLLGVLTQAGGVPANITLAIGIGVALVLRGQRRLAVAAMLTALAGGLLLLSLKDVFGRPRPPDPANWVTERNESFPSGHSMGSVIGYGLLAYLLLLPLVQRRQARAAIIVGLAVLLLLIGFSRIYLRAHYFSDVVAGFAVGTVCLALFILTHETLRRRQRRSGEATPAAAAEPANGVESPASLPPPRLRDKTL